LLDQTDIGGDDQIVRAVPGGPIDLHDDEELRERLADMRKSTDSSWRWKRSQQDERDQVASDRRDGSEDIDRLPDQLSRHMRPDARRGPTAPRPSDATKAPLILR